MRRVPPGGTVWRGPSGAHPDESQPGPAAGGSRLAVAAAFAAIYIVWGSTYLAIAMAVETLPPFLMTGARMLVAGGVLYGWSRWQGEAGLTREEWQWTVLTGLLLFVGGYGGVAWAEQEIDSGAAALLVSTSPLWLVLMQWARGGGRPGWAVWAGLGLGTAGVGRLMGGLAEAGSQLLPAGALLAAAAMWAAGSLRATRSPLRGSAGRSAGAEMIAGGVLLALAGVLLGEAPQVGGASFTLRSTAAFGYLVVFGSIIAFSAFRWLLQVRPPSLVATHAYVNPFAALLLGWAVAGESLGDGVLLAAISIVGAIALLRKYDG